jgi:PAS domain S-box-containing protein
MSGRSSERERLERVSSQAVLGALDPLHDAVFLVDRDGQILWLSEPVRRLAGAAADSIGTWMDLLADPAEADALKRELLARGRVAGRRVRLRVAGADEVTVSVRIGRVVSGADSPPLVLALIDRLEARDADRSAVDRELRHTVDYLGAMLDSSPEAVLAVNRAGLVSYANAALERLLGFSEGTLLGQPAVGLFTGADGGDALVRTLAREEQSFARDVAVRRRDGSPRWLHLSASPLRLPGGQHAGSVVFLRDVTSERQDAAELARKNSQLESYVHSVSHDLRSPLVSLLGFVRLLREDYGDVLGDQGRHFLDRVDQAGRTMEGLIHDLLELSRIGGTSEHKALVDPLPILRQLRAELKPRLEAQRIRLDFPDAMPLVLCDRTRLYQLFSNLVGNAVDHMGPREDARIEIGVTDAGNVHVIEVRDNGRGIDPAHHERIFEIFQSLGPRADGRANSGVGLAIVKKIAETHGGTVWVESALGEGETYRVSLPHT